MSIKVSIGDFSIDNTSGSGDIVVSTPRMTEATPQWVFVFRFGLAQATNTVSRTTMAANIGWFSSATNAVSCSGVVRDNQASTDTGRQHDNTSLDNCFFQNPGQGMLVPKATGPFAAGQFTVTYTDAYDGGTPNNMKAFFLAVSGIRNAASQYYRTSPTRENYDHGGSWVPDVLFGMTTCAGTNSSASSTSQISLGFGAAVSATSRFTCCSFSNGGQVAASRTATLNRDDLVVASISAQDDVSRRWDLASFDATGANLTGIEGDCAGFYGPIESFTGDVRIVKITTRTTLGEIVVTGLPFPPRALIFESTMTPASPNQDLTEETQGSLVIGVCDDLMYQRCQGYAEQENVTPTRVTTAIEYDSSYVSLNAATSALAGRIVLKRTTKDGFVLEQTAADATANALYCVAFGPGQINTRIVFLTQATATNQTGTSIVVDKPAGTVEGDFLLASFITVDNGTNSLPGGWNLIANRSQGGVRQTMGWKAAGASEPANYTFTVTTSGEKCVAIMRLANVDPTTPVNAQAVDGNTGATATCPSVTTTTAGTFVFRMTGSATGHRTITAQPAGRILHEITSGGAASDSRMHGAYTRQEEIGATGTAAWTLSASHTWTTATVALQPTRAVITPQAPAGRQRSRPGSKQARVRSRNRSRSAQPDLTRYLKYAWMADLSPGIDNFFDWGVERIYGDAVNVTDRLEKRGRVYVFNGTNAEVNFTSAINGKPDLPQAAGTLAFWYRPTEALGSTDHPIFDWRDSLQSSRFVYYPFTDGILYAGWRSNLGDTRVQWTISGITANTWYHTAVRWHPAGTQLLFDGRVVAENTSTPLTWSTRNSATTQRLGKNHGGTAWAAFDTTGFQVYKTRLTDPQIRALMRDGMAPFRTRLLLPAKRIAVPPAPAVPEALGLHGIRQGHPHGLETVSQGLHEIDEGIIATT